ncbi:unnamed protein product [Mytilus edulis]|uniref:Uncharacterized protein n=1 Tax=Mytilus edulis TaxID=6550 RepID=A0A8S3S972_MYTED|nr:unnamed protein product [Mytilus edulis]
MSYNRESHSYKETTRQYGGEREMMSKGDEASGKKDGIHIIRTPALGRPFRLGMLYDRVHDTIIPGETVLTMADMEKHIYTQEKKVNPTTYEEAVRVYKELPSYLKKDEAVPVTVWLYPLKEGVMPTNKVTQPINKENMKQAVMTLDDLQRIYVSYREDTIPQAKIPDYARVVFYKNGEEKETSTFFSDEAVEMLSTETR